jgi:hypothetical protein
MTTRSIPALILPLALALPAHGSEATDLDPWELEERIAAVNDGRLRLIPDGPPGEVHTHENRIRITTESLADGWVTLEQCHAHLDAVPATQIVYHPERIRALRITSQEGLGRAWVEGHSVQLEDIEKGSRLCIAAESRALLDLGSGRYRLRTGPYMRRFLDGFYPMRVRLDVRFPLGILGFVRAEPEPQPGFDLNAAPGRIQVDTAFEGRLYTCLDFIAPRSPAAQAPAPPCTGD